tara:strand:- start:1037 stop:1741 length:705 start_codon:yes stop_codon:yes gene_type:complete
MIWTNMKNIRIKRIISFFVIILILLFMGSDYMQFDFDESFSVLIYGNKVVPDNVISNHLKGKQKNTEDIYPAMIESLEVVNLSSNKKLIIVNEDYPRFYDDKKIYLESGVEILYENYSNYNLIIDQINIPKFISYNDEVVISDKVLELINLLSKNNQILLNDLVSITLSKDKMLTMDIDGCEVILMDNVNADNLNGIPNKILVLNEFVNQTNEDMDRISQIDLRWSDKVFVKII